MTDNTGRVVAHYRYDARGNCISVTDISGHETDTIYNLADQPTEVHLPDSTPGGVGYLCRTSSYLYPGGPRIASINYDAFGNVAASVQNTYGAEGELLATTGSSNAATYTHGRPLSPRPRSPMATTIPPATPTMRWAMPRR